VNARILAQRMSIAITGKGVSMTLPEDYQVHMLRIWQYSAKNDRAEDAVRVTLENTKTAVRVSFSDIESMANYLQQQVDISAAA
jgi:hypothetical protein